VSFRSRLHFRQHMSCKAAPSLLVLSTLPTLYAPDGNEQTRSNAADAPWIDERMQLLVCDALPRRFILVGCFGQRGNEMAV
jgi:hypothetical protein